MIRRKWTSEEDDALRQMWGKCLCQAIADRLNRSLRSVYMRANDLDLSARRDKRLIAERRRRIRVWLAHGYSDSEIAAKLGVNREVVRDHRTRMRLPANGRNERYRRRVAEKTRQQCQASGVSSLAEIKAIEVRKLAEKYGWPSSLSMRSIQIVQLLYTHGPMTRRQINDAIGMKWRSSRKALSNSWVPGGSYLAELQRAGLVARLPRAVSGKGRGSSKDLYFVAIEVQPCPKETK